MKKIIALCFLFLSLFIAACGTSVKESTTPVVAAAEQAPSANAVLAEKITKCLNKIGWKENEPMPTFLTEEESRKHLAFTKETYARTEALPKNKIWRVGIAIGAPKGMTKIDNRLYQFSVSIENEFHYSSIWVYSAPTDGGFPRERVTFTYDHDIGLGYIEVRRYAEEGQGELTMDAIENRSHLNEMLALIDKIAKF